jgi:hypothetical protein
LLKSCYKQDAEGKQKKRECKRQQITKNKAMKASGKKENVSDSKLPKTKRRRQAEKKKM